MKENKKWLLFGFEADNVGEFYQVQYNRWRFENSDEVKADGVILTKEKKLAYQLSFFNVIPAPKNIEVSDIKDGFPLKEIDFIEIQINIYQKHYYDCLGSQVNLTNKSKLELYLGFLKKRKSSLLKENPYIKDNELNDLHEQLDITIRKKNALEKALVLAYDSEKKFALQEQIKELEKQIEQIKKKTINQ